MRRTETDADTGGSPAPGGHHQWPRRSAAAAVCLRATALSLLLLAAPITRTAAPAAAAEEETLAGEEPAEAGAGEAEAPAAYTVKIEGVDESGIRSTLERSSQLVALVDKPPLTQAALVRRIQGDFDRFRAVLRSEGYYDSLIDYRIDDQASPVAITVVVDTGPVYRLQLYDVLFQEESPETPRVPPPLSALGLRLDQPARAADVIGAEQRLLATLADEAHPLAHLVDREAIVDHNDRTMRVTVRIDPGPFTRFGPLTLLGLDTVQEDYIRALVPWSEGDPYDQRKVDARHRRVRVDLRGCCLVETESARIKLRQVPGRLSS